jgi:alkylation response protein AidB-like acyl-CoA dehydrogenase
LDFTLTAEQQKYRDLIRGFAAERIAPVAAELDEKALYPQEIFDEMKQLGLYGFTLPKEYGGSGADSISFAIALEELAKAAAGVAVAFAVHNSIGAFAINEYGTQEQKEELLPRMSAGEILTSFALTEEDAGSDAGAVKTTALRDGDEFVLNGRKRYITNGKYADLHTIVALTNPDRGKKGLSCLLVPADTPGFRVVRTENKMGQRCSDTAELEFTDCRVPVKNLLGKENRGLSISLRALDGGRFGVASIALGCGQAAFEKALHYAQQRKQFGQPIIGFQGIEFMLAEMGTQLEAARLMIYRAAWNKDQGLPYGKEAAMAKMFATEVAEMVCHRAIQIHGGAGYMKENDVERYYRDQRICQIYEGTNQIQRWVIAIQLIKEFGR